MFRKKETHTDDFESSTEKKPKAQFKTSIQQPAPALKGRKTVIGDKIIIEGAIQGNEDLVLDGILKGTIALENHELIVGPKGQVEAEIHAKNATVCGQLKGNILASGKVSFTKDADFIGEVKAKRIAVEDGAYLKALIELEREPRKPEKTGSAATPASRPATTPKEPPISLVDETKK